MAVKLRNDLAWRKSSYSDEEVNCVEVARLTSSHMGVRDSKVPDGAVLALGRQEWRALCGVLGERA